MERLAKLPVFLDLDGKRALVAGGGAGAAWKVELLAAAGARVEVFAVEPAPALSALAEARPAQISLRREPWTEADLTGVVVALLEPEHGEAEIAAFRARAKAAGAIVNVIDTPAACDFQFGTIVNRSPTIIGISTDGAAPILAQALRRRIEAILPAGLSAWSTAAKAFRDELAAIVSAKAGRRRFWERFVDLVFARSAPVSGAAEVLRRLAGEVSRDHAVSAGSGPRIVELAVEPADPERLTLRDIRLMQAADLIVHDAEVAPAILELGRREARRVVAPRDLAGLLARLDPEEPVTIVRLVASSGEQPAFVPQALAAAPAHLLARRPAPAAQMGRQ